MASDTFDVTPSTSHRYPTIASRIVEHVRYEGRFKKVSDLYEAEDIIQGNDNIKAAIKRNEARLVVN